MPFLEVLLACVRCPGGELLTHENVLSIFQACFRIGHYQTERSKDMSGSSPLSPCPGGIPLQATETSWARTHLGTFMSARLSASSKWKASSGCSHGACRAQCC